MVFYATKTTCCGVTYIMCMLKVILKPVELKISVKIIFKNVISDEICFNKAF